MFAEPWSCGWRRWLTERSDAPPDSIKSEWDRQLARMTMFDDLIGNPNRHVNNMLHDARWNLILIDYGRTFRAGDGSCLPL